MNKLRMGKVWLFMAISLVLLVVSACGPAESPNGTDTGEETAVTENASQNTASTTGEEVTASSPDTGTADDGVEMLTPPTAVPLPTPAEGAVVTDSGLQYLDVQTGEGPTPQDGDIVEIHLVAELADGTPLGDTHAQGSPIKVVMGTGQLFPGLEEGIKMMQPGGQASMVVPPDLIVDPASAGQVAPPPAAMLVDVELVSVSAAPEPTAVDEADYTTTDSGLQYYDLTEGDGDMPATGDSVTVDFTIWLEDGTFITSSDLGGGPLTFALGGGTVVFDGWDEGVATMKVGGERQLVIPSELALGENSAAGIPPNSTLIMEVTLDSYQEAPKMAEVDEGDYTVTDSGLKYYDLVEGDGATPETGQTVVVNYTGWLEDGTKFDSSLDAGSPFSFALGTGSVIPGWDEGVATMKVGTVRQLVIPPDLAYGEAGSGAVIPPNATLIFQVELLDIR